MQNARPRCRRRVGRLADHNSVHRSVIGPQGVGIGIGIGIDIDIGASVGIGVGIGVGVGIGIGIGIGVGIGIGIGIGIGLGFGRSEARPSAPRWATSCGRPRQADDRRNPRLAWNVVPLSF